MQIKLRRPKKRCPEIKKMNKQQMMRNFCLYRKEDERMEQESKPKKKKNSAKLEMQRPNH